MVLALVRRARHLLVGAALVGFGLTGARGEGLGLFNLRQQNCPAPSCPCPCPVAPETVPEPKTKDPSKELPPAVEPSIQPVTTAALGDGVSLSAPGGYIDNALPFTHFRLRFDAAYDANRPDRAEFFYAKCGCFGTRDAKGPPAQETRVDYQDVTAYLEVASNSMFSVFVEAPYRFLNPEANDNVSGFADMNAGIKAALWRSDAGIMTFQFRTYFPVGNSYKGLGTHHASLEPSLLFAQNLNDKLLLFGQIGDWIPVGGSDFAGNIIRYGVGASYLLIDQPRWRLAPVAEVLGWSVLGGYEFIHPGDVIKSASGETIVNGKLGVRIGFGEVENLLGTLGKSDLYVGYGRALTGDVWYTDILRVEYRLRF